MISFMFLNVILLLFSRAISQETVQWNSNVITKVVKPLVRNTTESWTNVNRNQNFHQKTHFGVIIKQGTSFTLMIEAPSAIEKLFFYCLAESPRGEFNILDLSGETTSSKIVTANFDCVPMVSISHNILVEIKIITSNWEILPVFDSKGVTILTSQKVESAFYRQVKIYAFVENYYTQMLLSLKDIWDIQYSGNSLYLGLQNQVDVLEYYDYLTGTNTYKTEEFPLERSTLFIHSERCHEQFFKNYPTEVMNPSFENLCANNDTLCNSIEDAPCSNTNFNPHGISVGKRIQRFLQTVKGSSWILLQTFAKYYNKEENVAGFGKTFDIWNDIFAALYYHKFQVKKHRTKPVYPYSLNSVLNYQKGVSFKKWSHDEKLNFFMSLFGFDGTDKPFREFYIRYEPLKKKVNTNFNNMIPTFLEMFHDLYDVNLLPFFRRVIDFNEYTIPLVNPDLEMLLLSGYPIMPAIDFNINPSDLQIRSKERDARQFSPLMLLTKMKKMYVNVKFTIVAPIDLTDRCLYLNNICHRISELKMKLQLLTGVYSAYIAEEIDNNLYISEITYHTVAKNMQIRINVKEVNEKNTFLPLIHYTIDARGFNDELFLRLFINYKDMTIRIQQFTDQIHSYFENQLYFSVSLKRNGDCVFQYEFFGLQDRKRFVNDVREFKVGDEIEFYHREPARMQVSFEAFGNESQNNTFLFMNTGLKSCTNGLGLKTVTLDIKRIDKFNKDYYVDLSYNTLYQVYLSRYIRSLLHNEEGMYIPKDWFSFSNYRFW